MNGIGLGLLIAFLALSSCSGDTNSTDVSTQVEASVVQDPVIITVVDTGDDDIRSN